MKAWKLYGIGDIRYEDMERPVPKEGETLVRVAAAGICGSDIPRVYDTGAHRMPLIIGHEFSGIVEEAGRRVGVFPLIPCRVCGPCLTGHYEMCRSYDYIGSRRDGAFAEYVSVPEWNLIDLPEGVSFEAATMLEPMAVAVHAMRIGTAEFTLPRESKVAVCGLGTIGLLLTAFLYEAGYRNLFLIGNKDFQRKKALELGIEKERFCDSRATDAGAWLKTQGGARVFFECVGRQESLCYGLEGVAPGGRIVTVGNPHGDISLPRDAYWKILRDQLTVMGTWNSSFAGAESENASRDDWHYVLKRLAEKKVAPEKLITHRLGQEELEKGLRVMKDKTEEYCKIMISFGQDKG